MKSAFPSLFEAFDIQAVDKLPRAAFKDPIRASARRH